MDNNNDLLYWKLGQMNAAKGYAASAKGKGSGVNWEAYWATQTEAKAFGDAAGITDETTQRALADLVTDLKAINATQANFVNFATPANSILRAVYPLVGGTATSQKYNLIDPRDLDAAFRIAWANDNAAAHTVNGYKPNGINQYGDTKLVPNTSLTLHSGHIGYYSTEELANTLCGAYEASKNYFIGADYVDGVFIGNEVVASSMNASTTNAATANFSGINFLVGNRSTNAIHSLWRSGGKIYINTGENSGTLPAISLYLGAVNGSTKYYSAGTIGYATIGASITDAAMVLYDAAVYKFMLALGRVAARVTTKTRAGVALTTDDFNRNVANYITTNRLYLNSGYGFKWTAWSEDVSLDATDVANGLTLLANGCEFGTHAETEVYRETHTPAETWWDKIRPTHDEIVAKLGVTPVSFAPHIAGIVYDTDMFEYLRDNQGYVNYRLYAAPEADIYYDGTDQIVNGYNYANSVSDWAEMKGLIDAALTGDKILVVMTHTISATNDDLNITEALFYKALAYIQYKNMTFYHMSELVPSLYE